MSTPNVFAPKIVIPKEVYEKIMFWIDLENAEVSGFGSLDYEESTHTFTVRDAIVLKQKVTGASTEIDANALGKAMYEMRNEPNALKWHWHSHVDMGVFWSQDDMTLIRELGQRGWILATVFNRRRESKSAFLSTVDLIGQKHDVFLNDIPTTVIQPTAHPMSEEWTREFKANVSRSYHVTNYDPKKKQIWDGKKRAWVDEISDETKESEEKDNLFDYSGVHYHDYTDEELEDLYNKWGVQKPPKKEAIDFTKQVFNYDMHGYATNLEFEFYNPMEDQSLRTESEKMEAIAELDSEEVIRCCKADASFRTLYAKLRREQMNAKA